MTSESWQLCIDNYHIAKKIVYYLLEFYTGKQIKISKIVGEKLLLLKRKKLKAYNKYSLYEAEMLDIMQRIVKRNRK